MNFTDEKYYLISIDTEQDEWGEIITEGYNPKCSPVSDDILYLNNSIYDEERLFIHFADINHEYNIGPNGEVGAYCWSPDGDRIAYSDRFDNRIYTTDMEGTLHVQITESEAHCPIDIVWSPDGTKLLYNLNP